MAPRLIEVDAVRGIAIAMMIAYHLFFDLDYFGIAHMPLQEVPLRLLQLATGSLFVLVAGVSLTLSEARNKEGYAHHLRRGLKLAAVALLITLATWVYPHTAFIKFGIIHMLAVSTLLAPFFFRFGKLNALLGLLVILAGLYAGGMQAGSPYLFWLGITYPGYEALDHYPLLPWFGVVLIGVFCGQTLFPAGKSMLRPAGPTSSAPGSRPPGSTGTGELAAAAAWSSVLGSGLVSVVAFAGRNSLLIYLVHQPLLIAALLAIKMAAGVSLRVGRRHTLRWGKETMERRRNVGIKENRKIRKE